MTQLCRKTLKQFAEEADAAAIIVVLVAGAGCVAYLFGIAVLVHFVVKFW